MTDAELLECWGEGDQAAAESLIRRHLQLVHRFFHGKVSSELDDLVQRTFLKCVERRHTLREAASFRAFLLGIARFELLTHYRKRQHAPRVDPSVASLVELVPSPPSIIAKHREQRRLLAALRRIPLDLQLVVELHYWEQLSSFEIAEILEVPAGTVRSRLRRARERIAAVLTELEGESVASQTMSDFETWAARLREE